MKIAMFWLILSCLFTSRLFVRAAIEDPEGFHKVTSSVRKKCIAETGTTVEDVENTEYGQFPDDDRLKCYFKCALEKFKVMDKKGNMNFDIVRKTIPSVYKDILDDMIDTCSDIGGKDKCAKAFNFMKCMFQANPIVSQITLFFIFHCTLVRKKNILDVSFLGLPRAINDSARDRDASAMCVYDDETG
ncbi:odorant binding protein 11 isoform X2 [Megachile rotundata]|uniref:odorant binding protein 11 isoform X2 n=1 Tax=Megachile rotundata TaxID=143995 RepID=UPI003FD5F125